MDTSAVDKTENAKTFHDDVLEKPEITDGTAVAHDAVFGTITEDGPNYRSVGWVASAVLMMKCQIGLGVLSIPAAFDILGMIPGIICMLIIASLTTWGSYVIGGFKLNHPEIYGVDEATGLMFGRIGQEVLGIGFIMFLIFAAGSGMLGISIGFNAVSAHGTCTAVFVAVAALIAILCASLRTLGRISFLAWVGLFSILIALLTVTIAVGVQDRPDAAPPGPWVSDYKIIASPNFTDAISAISMLIFAYAGSPFYFPIVAEMREPRKYPRSLILCQSVVTVAYLVIGIIVYYFCGSYVASPALGSAGKLLKRVSYGIAIPGLIVSTTLSTHLASKHVFVRMLRGSEHLSANTFTHWASWIGCVLTVAVIAYIIASVIPVFGTLVSLIGALFGTLMCFQPLGCMWLYDNWSRGKENKTPKWLFLVFINILLIVSGTFLMVAGTYGSIIAIIDSYKLNGGTRPWSCGDNSNSV